MVHARVRGFSLILLSLVATATSYGQETLKFTLPENTTSTTKVELPWRPPRPQGMSEIYDYTTRAMASAGSGVGNSMQGNTLGKTLSAQTQSHLLGVRYTLTEKWATRVVGAAVDNQYTILKKDGSQEDVYVQGMGDMKVQAVYQIYEDPYHRFEASAGTTIPTGATDLIGPNGKPLSSRMQLGSGTFDFVPEVSYTFTSHGWELGDRINAVIHNGKNSSGYTNGDEYGDSASANYLLFPFLSPSITVSLRNKQKGSTDHPLSIDRSQQKMAAKDAGGNVLPGPTSPQDSTQSPGWSFDGTAALRSRIPLPKSSPIKATVEVGMPIFSSGKSDTGMKTLWFAGSSLTGTF
jgi:hypothetical protein